MGFKKILSGIFPSITTPFTRGKVDYGQLRLNIEKYNALELGGYMILGGNGEYLGLTPDESLKVVKTIISVNKPGNPIVAGAGRESAQATIELIKSIAGIGADIASVITPFYYARYMKDENLVAYYRKIADESPIPILIYNSPSYAAGVEISPGAVASLSAHENIAGMKSSSNRPISDYTAAAGVKKGFCFHVGKILNLCRDFQSGAVGATLSMADYWPEACINGYTLLKQGRDDEAAALCRKIDQAGKTGASVYGVAGVKYAMDLAGYCGGEPRLPWLPLDETQKEQVRKSFAIKGDAGVL